MHDHDQARAVIDRLQSAIGAHDLDALASCFAPDVESVQPAHPARRFRGSDQVRRNFAQIFGAVPDLHATLLDLTIAGNRTWTEWQWTGTRVDGVAFEMRGITIQDIEGDRIAAVRFYMEPVDHSGVAIDGAIREIVAS